MSKITELVDRARALLARLAWIGPLLARVAVGSVFVQTGWGKLHDLATVTDYFTQLGIPAPGLNALAAAVTELAGGIAIVAGLGTRLAALPLTVVMTVAILTAKRADLEGLGDLFGLEEFTYIVVFVWLFVAGPGAASLDRLIDGRAHARDARTEAANAAHAVRA